MSDWFASWTRDGYFLLPAALTPEQVETARQSVAQVLAAPAAQDSLIVGKAGPPHGARNLLRLWPDVARLVQTPRLLAVLSHMLGTRAGLVRGLYFDKPPGSTWALPWHRDLSIAVLRHLEHGCFRKPTIKAGVPHVEATPDLLESMVTVRIHLDAMDDTNGPLRVLPGSHLSESEVVQDDRQAVTLHCAAGDVLLTRPLLLHASGHCLPVHHGHRRIVHLELAPTPELPDGYAWHTFLPLFANMPPY